eukprot:15094467-Alexandrium_andersonii.AAC.1
MGELWKEGRGLIAAPVCVRARRTPSDVRNVRRSTGTAARSVMCLYRECVAPPRRSSPAADSEEPFRRAEAGLPNRSAPFRER